MSSVDDDAAAQVRARLRKESQSNEVVRKEIQPGMIVRRRRKTPVATAPELPEEAAPTVAETAPPAAPTQGVRIIKPAPSAATVSDLEGAETEEVEVDTHEAEVAALATAVSSTAEAESIEAETPEAEEELETTPETSAQGDEVASDEEQADAKAKKKRKKRKEIPIGPQVKVISMPAPAPPPAAAAAAAPAKAKPKTEAEKAAETDASGQSKKRRKDRRVVDFSTSLSEEEDRRRASLLVKKKGGPDADRPVGARARNRKKRGGDLDVREGGALLGQGAQPPKSGKRKLKIDEAIRVADMAHQMGVKSPAVIKILMGLGVLATINHALDVETATLVAAEFGYEVERVGFSEEALMAPQHTEAAKSCSWTPRATKPSPPCAPAAPRSRTSSSWSWRLTTASWTRPERPSATPRRLACPSWSR